MSDIFHEIEEEVRRQQYEKLWKRYGTYIIGGVVAIVVAIAAYIGYRDYHQAELDRASAAYSQLVDESQADPVKSVDAIRQFAANAPSGYRALALFAEAAATIPKDRTAALKIYEQITSEYPDPYIGGLARLKGAMLVSDSETPDQLRQRLSPLTGDDGMWRYSARELIAYASYRAGDMKTAREEFDRLRSDLAAPGGVRSRSEQMVGQIDLRLAGVTPRVVAAPAAETPPAEGAPQDGEPALPGDDPALPAEPEPAPATPPASPTPNQP